MKYPIESSSGLFLRSIANDQRQFEEKCDHPVGIKVWPENFISRDVGTSKLLKLANVKLNCEYLISKSWLKIYKIMSSDISHL
jgi:hypothetical protein